MPKTLKQLREGWGRNQHASAAIWHDGETIIAKRGEHHIDLIHKLMHHPKHRFAKKYSMSRSDPGLESHVDSLIEKGKIKMGQHNHKTNKTEFYKDWDTAIKKTID